MGGSGRYSPGQVHHGLQDVVTQGSAALSKGDPQLLQADRGVGALGEPSERPGQPWWSSQQTEPHPVRPWANPDGGGGGGEAAPPPTPPTPPPRAGHRSKMPPRRLSTALAGSDGGKPVSQLGETSLGGILNC